MKAILPFYKSGIQGLALIKKMRLLAFVCLLYVITCQPEAASQTVKHSATEVTATAKHYSYPYFLSQTQKKDIEYILVKASNGDIKSCFNACDVCYKYYKGYSQSGNELRCNNCGNRFKIDELGNQGKGGCWPGYLPHTLDGDSISIISGDLISGEYYFLLQNVSQVGVDTDNENCGNLNITTKNDVLLVKMPSQADRTYRIFSMNGDLYKSVAGFSAEVEIGINDLSSGVYMLAVEESGNYHCKCIIINR